MSEVKDLILDKAKIIQKIRRISYEIFENNIGEKEIIIAGIETGGFKLAKMVLKELEAITSFKLTLVKVIVDKKGPLNSHVKVDCDEQTIKGQVIILVDDVLHTGKTFILGMKPFLNSNPKKIQTCVLVNRGYSNFPISATYTGYELSTTLNDQIEVVLDQKNFGVYLY